MKNLAAFGLILLAGCATPPQPLPVLTPEIAQQMPAAQLCLGLSTFRAGNVPPAREEIARRGINCADHTEAMKAILQERIARAQAASAAPAPVYLPQQPLISPLTYTPILPPTVHCTSTPGYGGQVSTVCR